MSARDPVQKPASHERTPFTQAWADAAGNRPCLLDDAGALSYPDLVMAVARMQDTLLAAGIRPGDVIAILGDFTRQNIVTFLALLEGHAIAVPISETAAQEIETRLILSQADWVVDWSCHRVEKLGATQPPQKHPLLAHLAEVPRAGLVLFSSGSTGTPKALVHDLEALARRYAPKPTPREANILLFLLFDHIGGLDTLFRALAAGATLTLPPAKDPETVAQCIARHRVTVLPTSPSFLSLLLMTGADQRADLSSLQIIGYGAEPMPEGLLHRLIARLPHVTFQQKFGTSETSAIHVTNHSPGSLLMKITDPDVAYRIVDGELWLRSPTPALGYLNADTDAAFEDGWFKTGDIVESTLDGHLRIIGRKSDLINVGGQKVYPTEVESVLMTLDGIADCRVYGEAHPLLGQTVVAEVVFAGKPPADRISHWLREQCQDRLAPYKIPSKVRVLAAIPTTARAKRIRRPHG